MSHISESRARRIESYPSVPYRPLSGRYPPIYLGVLYVWFAGISEFENASNFIGGTAVLWCSCEVRMQYVCKWERLFFLQVDAAHLLGTGVSWRYTRHVSCMFVRLPSGILISAAWITIPLPRTGNISFVPWQSRLTAQVMNGVGLIEHWCSSWALAQGMRN